MWNFLKTDFYLTKVLLKISKKDIKRKESQRSNPKNCLWEEAPKDMSLYKSFDFSEGGIGVAKIAFSFKRLYYGWIFFSRWLFFLGQGEKYTGKKLTETQSMKT